jgi:MFS family permease
MCPVIGMIGDKCGRRTQFIMIAHLILILAFIISLSLPECHDDNKCYYEFAPLLFIGFGYSIFITIFYSSIPLLVE